MCIVHNDLSQLYSTQTSVTKINVPVGSLCKFRNPILGLFWTYLSQFCDNFNGFLFILIHLHNNADSHNGPTGT